MSHSLNKAPVFPGIICHSYSWGRTHDLQIRHEKWQRSCTMMQMLDNRLICLSVWRWTAGEKEIALTHHIDGWHRPDAVDIYAHIDDSWFHCKSQKEEEWVMVAAHIVVWTWEIYTHNHSILLFSRQKWASEPVACQRAKNKINAENTNGGYHHSQHHLYRYT